MNNFWWHLHNLQYANEPSCKSQIARREKGRWRERKQGGSRVEERETDGGWCKLWMQPAISKRKKKGREKPQAMHIRLRIYHIFLSWSVSKLVYNLASVCEWVTVWVCVCAFEKSGRALTHSSMSSCAELCCAVRRSLNLIWRVSIARLTLAALLCVALRVYSHMAPDNSHTHVSFQCRACTRTQWQICSVRSSWIWHQSNHSVYSYDIV